jgi:hypothetical protein
LTEGIIGPVILEIKAVSKLPESLKSPLRGYCLFHFSESRLVYGFPFTPRTAATAYAAIPSGAPWLSFRDCASLRAE